VQAAREPGRFYLKPGRTMT